ncbi:cellulose binding domain-containing protein [Solwaraspora sp. WMMD792]|uniref:cellulose binding domain-containing protein n=1 Tax=Solwaraspora sp. WMMD792 TaxID=3016099 RepID=UPI002415A7C3|nr:cellulose binding domain-containing protein [Solwaraspora sp. WMMD792]MDG4770248.1 cellulose binding domain-containing protein [Solwaraspora sp. WMMD792]
MSRYPRRAAWPVVALATAAATAGMTVVTTLSASAASGCQVTYTIGAQWPGGFGANLAITNYGEPIDGWTLSWTFAAGQTITQSWGFTADPASGTVVARNASYTGSILTGATVGGGFNGTWNDSSNPVPSTFTLNGTVCTGPGPTSPPVTTAPPTPPTTAPPTTVPPPTDTLFVATNGNDANPGTVGAPLATLARAVALATPGTTITLRGGTYQFDTNVRIMKDGTAANPYTITSYDGERVVLDGENLPHTPAPVGGSIPNLERGVLHIEADYWRVRDLEIAHGPYAIFCRDCSNNVFERLVTRDNYESGLQIQGAASNNQVIDLDSYGNRDPRKNGESADGLAIKEGSGSGNVVRGARLWNNSDDGFDAWLFTSPILIEDSAAWGNGFNRWDLPGYSGDGNGFKMGGGDPDPPANHTIRNSFAFDNAVGGFIDNGNPGTITVERNSAWRNGDGGFKFANSTSRLTGNLAIGNGAGVSLGNSTATGNSWNIKSSWSAADLVSTDPSLLIGPRDADGGIRSSAFLRPHSYPNLGARS